MDSLIYEDWGTFACGLLRLSSQSTALHRLTNTCCIEVQVENWDMFAVREFMFDFKVGKVVFLNGQNSIEDIRLLIIDAIQ